MLRIQTNLRHCYHLADVVRTLLNEALDLANDNDYDPHWISAINTAIQDNRQVWLQTHNVATCIDPTAPLPRPEEP